MLCLPVGLQPAEIPRPRVGANSPTPCDVCTKLSVGPFVCVISSAHAELSLSGTRPNCPRYRRQLRPTLKCAKSKIMGNWCCSSLGLLCQTLPQRPQVSLAMLSSWISRNRHLGYRSIPIPDSQGPFAQIHPTERIGWWFMMLHMSGCKEI